MEDNAYKVDFEMLPFVMKELVAVVMKKKYLPLHNALGYIYSSKLYELLCDGETKMWYSGTLSLYEALEKEKAGERMRDEEHTNTLLFKMFCMENYRAKHDISAGEVLLLFFGYDVFAFLEKSFEMLHTQGTDYILDTISTYIKNKKRGV